MRSVVRRRLDEVFLLLPKQFAAPARAAPRRRPPPAAASRWPPVPPRQPAPAPQPGHVAPAPSTLQAAHEQLQPAWYQNIVSQHQKHLTRPSLLRCCTLDGKQDRGFKRMGPPEILSSAVVCTIADASITASPSWPPASAACATLAGAAPAAEQTATPRGPRPPPA